MVGRLIEWRGRGIGHAIRVIREPVLAAQCDFLPLMPGEPATMVVGLIHRNPVDPGLKTTVAPERPYVAKDFQKDLLHYIGGIRRIVKQTADQIVDRLLVALDQ